MKTNIKTYIICLLMAIISFSLWSCSSKYLADNGKTKHTQAGKRGFCMSQRSIGF